MHNTVERLPIVINDPPDIAYVMFPTLLQTFINIALIQLGIAHQRHHAGLHQIRSPLLCCNIILDQRSKASHGDTQTNRTG